MNQYHIRYYHAYETFVTCITLYLLAVLQFMGALISILLLLWAKKHCGYH